jgi:hypothetical protein
MKQNLIILAIIFSLTSCVNKEEYLIGYKQGLNEGIDDVISSISKNAKLDTIYSNDNNIFDTTTYTFDTTTYLISDKTLNCPNTIPLLSFKKSRDLGIHNGYLVSLDSLIEISSNQIKNKSIVTELIIRDSITFYLTNKY